MTTQPLPHLPSQPVNYAQLAFILTVALTVGGWVVVGAQATQRIEVLEQRTQPLANGDLVAVQRDVSWIRDRLEKDAGR